MEGNLKTSGIIEQRVLFKKKDGDIYCIGSRTSNKYIYAPSKEANIIFFVLKQIESNKQLCEIIKNTEKKYNIEQKNIDEIIQKCKQSGLLEVTEDEKIKRVKDEFDILMVNLKDFSLKQFYFIFDFFLNHLFLIKIFMLSIMTLALISSSVLFLMDKTIIFPWKNIFSNPVSLLFMWSIQLVSLLLHEFAHAIVGYYYGAIPKSFSIAIMYYSRFVFYINLPGIYFKDRKERLEIWSAGIFTNLFLASCFWLGFIISNNSVKEFLGIGVLCNIMLAVNNLLPFFYSDGYYLLSTFMKTPNLRKRSLFQFKELYKQGLCRESIIYWVYLFITGSITIILFGSQILLIVFSILNDLKNGLNLNNTLKNYLNLVIIILIATIGKLIGKLKSRQRKLGSEGV